MAEIAALAKQTKKSPDLIAQDELAEFLEKRRKNLPENEATLAVDAISFFYTQSPGRVWRDVAATPGVSQLCQRFIQNMLLRNLAPKNQQPYLRVSTYGVAAAALRFLYAQTRHRQWVLPYIALPKREKRLSDILSQSEMLAKLS